MNEHENARLQAAKDAITNALAAMDRIGDPVVTPGMRPRA